MTFEKLVRDNVAGNMRAQKLEPVVRRAVSDAEYELFLMQKLLEEIDEFRDAPTVDEIVKEGGDILSVLDALWTLKKVVREQVFAQMTPGQDLIVTEEDDAVDFVDEMQDYTERLQFCKTQEDIVGMSAAIIDAMRQALMCYELSLPQVLKAEQDNLKKGGGFTTRTIMLMKGKGVGVIRADHK